MESALAFMDDLLDFSSDVGEEEEEEEEEENGGNRKALSFNVLQKPKQPNDSCPRLLPEEEDYAEEELEWLSNKDAFPAVETFVDILSEQPRNVSKQHSPVSVLDNTSTSSNSNHSDTTNKNNIQVHGNGNGSSILMSCCGSLKVPGKARSKRRRKLISTQPLWFKHPTTNRNPKQILPTATTTTTVVASVTNTIGRKCLHCGAEKTPQWRAGPLGPKTLCNACGVRYKSGRLVPEYRPASSPTFSPQLHSNSHRKVIEMRRQKHLSMLVNPMDKG